ncbi:hypothetical protein OSB04_030682 [Centaurea solstitialis]|uniref:CMP/dCMP-type deaminase domain-containing protein n=1 Tax=Centaurea solstitialis TaxID=347529 RepID=A0AA38W590_9ASTR|nr:hypothetical protein OSB04_030682 [Centaurea solstitialis]
MASCEEREAPEIVAFMKLALEQAKIAFDSLEVPVGCVIVMDGKVISCGRNRTNETRNATRHAETDAIDVLLEQWKEKELTKAQVAEMFSKCYLYVTCEPCIMCAAALSFLGIKEVYYGCANDKFGGCGSILSLHTSTSEISTSIIPLVIVFMAQGDVNVLSVEDPDYKVPMVDKLRRGVTNVRVGSWRQKQCLSLETSMSLETLTLQNLIDSWFNSHEVFRHLAGLAIPRKRHVSCILHS